MEDLIALAFQLLNSLAKLLYGLIVAWMRVRVPGVIRQWVKRFFSWIFRCLAWPWVKLALMFPRLAWIQEYRPLLWVLSLLALLAVLSIAKYQGNL